MARTRFFRDQAAFRKWLDRYHGSNTKKLSAAVEKESRSHKKAWAFFQEQPPSYRQKVLHWLTSAKPEATCKRRLAKAIASFETGER